MRRASWILRTVLVGAAALALAAVLLSPFALGLLNVRGVDWDRLSAIGQTYGAASALLSGLALGGVALSVLLQVTANRRDRIQLARGLHLELTRMALDDPTLLECWGGAPVEEDERQLVYINLIVSYWQARWDTGASGEAEIRRFAADLFKAEIGRRFWRRHGANRIAGQAGSRRRRRPLHLMDQEYRRAIALGPPERPARAAPEPPATSAGTGRNTQLAVAAVALGATAAGVLLGRRLGRRQRVSRPVSRPGRPSPPR